MNTVANSQFQPGLTFDERQKVESKLRGGWLSMWLATILFLLFPISIFCACVAFGRGLGATSWPGYGSKGRKLAFWAIAGPLTPWLLIIGYALITKST